jgi:hypothetical protein
MFPVLFVVILTFPLFAPTLAAGQVQRPDVQDTESQNVQNHVITVSRSGEATAKPDLGILMMAIRSS